jgi:hypothetical protein
MSGIQIHREPEDIHRQFAPCAPAATATFDVGDPVQLSTNQLSDCNDDASEILINEIVGFACEPAEGIHAGSRANVGADGFGVVENQMRSYWPFDAPGLVLRTRNFWATGTAGTQVEKDGTEIGDNFTMTAAAGTNNWGLDETAPTYADGADGEERPGDDAAFVVIAILDDNMNPIDADATQTAGDGWIIFRPTGKSQLFHGGA